MVEEVWVSRGVGGVVGGVEGGSWGGGGGECEGREERKGGEERRTHSRETETQRGREEEMEK